MLAGRARGTGVGGRMQVGGREANSGGPEGGRATGTRWEGQMAVVSKWAGGALRDLAHKCRFRGRM